MSPLIAHGSEIQVDFFTQPKSLNECKRGEIVLLRMAGEWVVHRVVRGDKGFTTKGDWNLNFDPPEKAWGRLRSIDGLSSPFFHAPLFAQVSERIQSQTPPWLRRLHRGVLYILKSLQQLRSWRLIP